MRVLVVEDEKRIAGSIKKGLEQEAMAVDVAFDGEEGYDLALDNNYDVIILDLMLPKMHGLEVCKNLRSENIQTPILVLTARGETEDKVMGLNSGADDYLAKPFDFSELIARVNALARRPKNANSTILSAGELVLDTINLETTINNHEVMLSKKEFALLKYLMINKNKLLSKEQIIEKVWDFDSDILPNTVEVYMGYLRKKIGKKYFQTKRGFGYKFVDV